MATAPPTTLPRLKERYLNEIRPELVRRFGYSSVMQAPRIEKITLNMGVGDAKQDTRMLEAATEQLATIAGQRPSVRRARKSIAGFKIRDGMPVGVAVTLRDARMYEFLDRLTSVAIPRIRDFRGLNPRAFDGRGNYSLGIREQIIFPEIDYDAIDQVRGLDVVITTTAATDDEAFALLEAFGMPFRQDGRPGAGGEAVERAAEEERRVAEARERAEAEAAAREELREEDPEAYATPAGPAEEGTAGAHAEPGAAAEMTAGPGPTSEAPGATVERPDDTRAGRPGREAPPEAEEPAAERPDQPAGGQPEAASAPDAEGQPADARAPEPPDES